MGSRYLLNKVVQAIGTVFFIVILNFVLFRMMPGSPDRVLLRNPNVTAGDPRRGARAVGPRRPDARSSSSSTSAATLQGDLGYSFQYQGLPVTEVLAGRLWPTLILFGLGELIAIVVGLGLGAYSGWKRGGPVDYLGNGASLDPLLDAVLRHRHVHARDLRDRARLVPDQRHVRASARSTRRSGSSSATSPGTCSCRS